MQGSRLAASIAIILLLSLGATSAFAKGLFGVQTHAIRVLEPPDVAGEYEGAIGDFGTPLYGASLTGRVLAPKDNGNGCERFEDENYEAKWVDSDTPVIFLLSRGECFFVEKAYHAQRAGAAAVIVADTKPEPLITMTTPRDNPTVQELVPEIGIPTALVTKKLGDDLRRVLGAGGTVVLEMNWEEAVSNPDGRVEWELWTTANDGCGKSCEQQAEFKRRSAALQVELQSKGYTEFTPHFKVRACDRLSLYAREDCAKKCIRGGRYCSYTGVAAPHNETYGEKDVVVEDLRQLCVYDRLRERGQAEMWWNYAAGFAKECRMEDKAFDGKCARRVMEGMEVGGGSQSFVREVEACVGDPDEDAAHPVLERERRMEREMFKAGRGRVSYLPSIIVNGDQYRGRLERSSVLRALCAGFQENSEPGLCLADTMQTNECAGEDHGCWTNPNSAKESATCLDTFRGHLCQCPRGFIGDGFRCEPMNECTLGIANCHQICVDTEDGYECECEDGFLKVSGTSQCVLEDACKVNNGGCEQMCRSTTGEPECYCNVGYSIGADGRTCRDIDECAMGLDECEMRCINADPITSGGLRYMCACDPGYTLDFSDPHMRKCIESDKVLESLGVEEPKGKSPGHVAVEIVLATFLSALVVGAAGFVYYKFYHQRRLDREIKAILEQYVPLDDKSKGEGELKRTNTMASDYEVEPATPTTLVENR